MTDLVHTWLDRLLAFDIEGLVELYDDDAEMRAMSETYRGREEIEEGFAFARAFIRGATVLDVSATPKRMVFETDVQGKIGHARVRHTWDMVGDRILGHVAELVRHEKR